MLVTLLLPVILPYGNPYTAFNPRAHHQRKTDFFRWIQSESHQIQNDPQVPLLFSSN